MAFNVSGVVGYVNANEKSLIAKSVLKAKTAGLVEYLPGVKGSKNLNLLDASATLQAGGCGWNAAGSTTLSKRTLVTGQFKVNEALCDKDLVGTFAEWGVKVGVGKTSLPFEEYIVNQKLASINKQVENLVWNGNLTGATSTYLDYADGFRQVIKDSTGVIDATASGVTLANMPVKAIENIIAAIPNEIIDADDVVIFAGMEIVRAYISAVNASNQYHTFLELTPDMTVVIPGTMIKLIGVAGLNGKNEAYASTLSNFYVGGDMEGDESQFKFWYSEDNSEFRLKVEFNLGTQIAFPEFVVKSIA